MNTRNTRRALAQRTLLAAATLVAALTVAACNKPPTATPVIPATTTSGSSPHVAKNTMDVVTIRNFAFQPATLTVAAGSKVEWTNGDDEPHRVVSSDNQFPASPALDTDDSYTTVLAKPGIYNYYCSIHPHMVGKIIVK
jgi:plastocyanin